MRNKKIAISTIILSFLFLPLAPGIYAQSNEEITVDENIGLQEIRIPIFSNNNAIDLEYASVISWLSFAGNAFILVTIFFWIYRILLASLYVMRNSAESEKLAEAWKRVQSVFIGASMSFLIPLVLSIIGLALNVGYVWEWPLAFRNCKNSSEYDYYFQALNEFSKDQSISREDIDALCFGN